jgi:hypothetical protein
MSPLVLLFLGLIGGYGVYRLLRGAMAPPRRRLNRRRGLELGEGSDEDSEDTLQDYTGAEVADLLLRMADRYENSGDTSAAEAAREAANRAQAQGDGEAARQAANDYLSSVNAGAVAHAFAKAEAGESSSRSSDSSGSSPADGGSTASYSDNS